MRRRLVTGAAAALLALAAGAHGAEFQPLGALGIGGAGVARPQGALTAYWNPAGGAFNERAFSFVAGAQAGVRGNDALTQNIDRLNEIDFDSIRSLDSGSATAKSVGDVVKAVSILSDIEKRDGHLAITGAAPVGFAVKHVSFGVFGNFEGYAQPLPDTVNILPELDSTGTSVTATDFYNAVKNDPSAASSNGYFSASQYNDMVGVFHNNGLTTAQAQAVVNVIEAQLINSGIPASTVTAATVTSLNSALKSGTDATLNKNTSSVMTKALLYIEVPLAYGHPINLGKYGMLGVGASVKVIRGTVYQNQVLLVNNGSVDSGDVLKDITKNNETSTNFGIDLGALWKYQDKLSVGLVAKNLNSPSFTAPTYNEPFFNTTTGTMQTRARKGSDVTLEPQVRGGISYDVLSWLSLAADLDLTENSSVVPSASVKSRNLGGGLELHPYSWLKFRLGAYKNLASSDVGPVATAGITLGPLDIDGAFGTDTFKVNGNTYPQEAKVQLLCGFSF